MQQRIKCSGLGALPQTVRMYGKAWQQRHGLFIRCCLVELLQEPQVAFIEQTQVADAITQHRQALQAGAESKADEFFWIETKVAHHIRVHLARARYFQPAALQGAGTESD